MSELLEIEFLLDYQNNPYIHSYQQQDKFWEKCLKFTVLVVTVGAIVYFYGPKLCSAAESVKEKGKAVFDSPKEIEQEFRKLYKEYDFRPNQSKKYNVEGAKAIGRKLGGKVVETELVQVGIDILTKTKGIELVLPKAYPLTTISSISTISRRLRPVMILPFVDGTTPKLVPLVEAVLSKVQLKMLPLRGGALIVFSLFSVFDFLPPFPGRDFVIKRGLKKVKKLFESFTDEKEEEKKTNPLTNFSVSSGSALALSTFFAIWAIRGRLPGPKSAREYDDLPELIKPLVAKPTKTQRFKERILTPFTYVYNFRTPVPYIIIGGFVIYLKSNTILQMFGSQGMKTELGEVVQNIMSALQSQFKEFVDFVKLTNAHTFENVNFFNTLFPNQLKTRQKEFEDMSKDSSFQNLLRLALQNDMN